MVTTVHAKSFRANSTATDRTVLTNSEYEILGSLDISESDNNRKTEFLSLIIKGISTCNLACKYCDADIYSNRKMDFRTLATLIKKALSYGKIIDFIWHGGEPTLLGIEFYEKALYLQNIFKRKDQIVRNSIQTNGTLLNEQWVRFFKDNKFSVGISLDGQQALHNANRVFKNGNGSFDNVFRGIKLLRDAKVNSGVLAVITEDTLNTKPKDFLDFFIKNGIFNFGLNWQRPAYNIQRDDNLVRSKYSDFLNGLFDVWYKLGNPDIHIREFDSIISKVLGGKKGFCILEGGCIGKYLGITTTGDIFHCDEFMFDMDYKLGNISYGTFDNILSDDNERIKKLKDANNKQIKQLDCEWLNVCHGGCPKDRYIYIKGGNNPTCCGWNEIISHIYRRVYNNELSKEISVNK